MKPRIFTSPTWNVSALNAILKPIRLPYLHKYNIYFNPFLRTKCGHFQPLSHSKKSTLSASTLKASDRFINATLNKQRRKKVTFPLPKNYPNINNHRKRPKTRGPNRFQRGFMRVERFSFEQRKGQLENLFVVSEFSPKQRLGRRKWGELGIWGYLGVSRFA